MQYATTCAYPYRACAHIHTLKMNTSIFFVGTKHWPKQVPSDESEELWSDFLFTCQQSPMREEITYVTSVSIGSRPCYTLSHASCLVCQSYYQTVLAVGRLQALALMARGHLRLPQNQGWLLGQQAYGVPLRTETFAISYKIYINFFIVHFIAPINWGCLCQALLLIIASKSSVFFFEIMHQDLNRFLKFNVKITIMLLEWNSRNPNSCKPLVSHRIEDVEMYLYTHKLVLNLSVGY